MSELKPHPAIQHVAVPESELIQLTPVENPVWNSLSPRERALYHYHKIMAKVGATLAMSTFIYPSFIRAGEDFSVNQLDLGDKFISYGAIAMSIMVPAYAALYNEYRADAVYSGE